MFVYKILLSVSFEPPIHVAFFRDLAKKPGQKLFIEMTLLSPGEFCGRILGWVRKGKKRGRATMGGRFSRPELSRTI